MNSRLTELDALRGIAAIAVVIFHYFYHYNIQYGHPGLNVGWSLIGKSGVELFFMVSGFVIFMTLNRTQQASDFVISRFSRLFPAYWLAVLLTFTTVSFFGLPGREATISDAIINLTMIQQLLGVANVDGVYWTLLVELLFYCLMLALFSLGQLKRIEQVLIVFIAYAVYSALTIDAPDEASAAYLVPRNASFFLAGICYYKLSQHKGNRLTYFYLFVALASTALTHSLKHLVIYSCFYGLFFLLIQNKLAILNQKALIFIGGISYSLYLIHQNIGYVIINQAYSFDIHPYIGIGLAFSISFALACFISTFVEKPALKAIRIYFGKTKASPAELNRNEL